MRSQKRIDYCGILQLVQGVNLSLAWRSKRLETVEQFLWDGIYVAKFKLPFVDQM